MLPADFHIHTHHSGDSDAPMSDVCESAIQRGVSSICITEHMDFDYPVLPEQPAGLFEVDTDAYREEFLQMKEIYAARLDMFWGIEIGMQPHITAKNSDYIKSYPFDFVIGSNHLCRKADPYYASFYEGRSLSQAYEDFFSSTLENIQLFEDFDVLGHLDYIVRYAPGKESGYNSADYADIIDEILRVLIDKGKGLDVNSKALYGNSNPPFENPNPCLKIIRRYKELGGRIITLGSDAHRPEDVAGAFERLTQMVKSCGFTSYCTFSDREPVFHNL